MTSVNVAPIQFHGKENDWALQGRNLHIRVAILFFMRMADYFFKLIEFCCHGALFLWQHQHFMNTWCFSNMVVMATFA